MFSCVVTPIESRLVHMHEMHMNEQLSHDTREHMYILHNTWTWPYMCQNSFRQPIADRVAQNFQILKIRILRSTEFWVTRPVNMFKYYTTHWRDFFVPELIYIHEVTHWVTPYVNHTYENSYVCELYNERLTQWCHTWMPYVWKFYVWTFVCIWIINERLTELCHTWMCFVWKFIYNEIYVRIHVALHIWKFI